MMQDCCGGMGLMMWAFMLLGLALLVAIIVWIVKQEVIVRRTVNLSAYRNLNLGSSAGIISKLI